MLMRRHLAYGFAVAMVLTLCACGFQLRGAGKFTNFLPFKTIYLGFSESSSLGAELKRHIRAIGATQVVDSAQAAQAVLEVISESREKVVLSLNTQGRVREYTLYYKLNFRVKESQGQVLLAPTEIVVKRDISFNEAQVIAKEREEELLYRDMQSDLVQQILRRLAAIK